MNQSQFTHGMVYSSCRNVRKLHRILTPSLLLGIKRCQDSGMTEALVRDDNARCQPIVKVWRHLSQWWIDTWLYTS